nr:OmpA family protein [Lysobacter silvisoli]
MTNTGNVTITGIAVNDAQLDAAAVCPVTTLAPGASTTCTGTHTITQAEVDAGVSNNSATASGTDPNGGTATSPPDTTATLIDVNPALTIDKNAGTPSGNTAGSTIAYSFLVTNTGNATITGIAVDDAQLDAAATCPVTTLAPGATTTCTGTHTITQAEVDAGTVNNSATVTGTPPGGGTTTSPPDTTTTPIAPAPALTVDKTAGTPSGNTAGSTIAYTFLVTNTGNVTITGIAVNDAQLDAPAVCPVTTLAPGASTTCTGTHTITQAEVDAGTSNNSATVTGTPPGGGTTTSPPDTTTTPIAPAPAMTVDKTAGTPSGNTAGSTIAYTFLVTNTGNVTITGIAVNDAQLDAAAVCPVTTLAPGVSTTCTGTHTITQAEVDAGTSNNSATASGTDPSGGTTTSPPDTTTTPIASAPALTIDKTAGTPSGNSAGSTIAYTFLVTNTGNVTITGIAVNDAQLDAAAVCPVTTLAPGASTTCTGTHTITQAEVDAGVVNNSATVTGTPPGGGTTTSPPDTTTTPIAPAPALTIDKTAGTPSGSTAGSTIAYTFLVTNTGNVTITGIAVNDAQLDAAATCPVTTLAPGATTTCTGTHTITQAEVDAGTSNNSATASGTDPAGGTTTSPPDTTTTPIASTPALTLTKTASPTTVSAVGETVSYSFAVTNSGNVTISNLVINETAFSGTGTAPVITCPVTTLAPGASTTCTGSYTVTQADIDAGSVTNTATASGTDPTGGATTSPPSSATVTAAPAPALTIDKTAGTPSGNTAGSTIAYTFLVTNTGNVTITGIAVNDAQLDAAAVCPVTTLAPGASTTCTGTHTITQAEVDAGTSNNSATASGTDPTGGTTTSPPDTTTTPIASTPALTLTKTASPTTVSAVGDTVAYSFAVTNSGNVTISNLVINETAFSGTGTAPVISCPVTTLAPGASTTCTGSYTVTQADIDTGSITNTATASGMDPGSNPATSPPSSATVAVNPAPALTLTKTATPTTVSAAGDTVSYSFAVTNSGNVTISNLVINETAFSGTGTAPVITCPVTTLAPGASTTCTASYTVTQADVDAGTVTNTATASGTDPSGGATTSPSSTATVTVNPAPALTLTKIATPTTVSAVGDTVAYSFAVTNSGNVTINNLAINETAFSGTGTAPVVTCPVTTLAPGASTTCTASYTVTQADIDAGSVTNTATASGTDPSGGTTTSPPSSATVTVNANPVLTLTKTATPTTVSAVGDTVAYSFAVTNSGNVTIANLVINETAFSGTGTAPVVTCPVATLAPGASTTCTASYTVTQADIDAGSVTNTATASGTDPGNNPATSPPSSATVTVNPAPALTLTKTATPTTVSAVGDTVAYSFAVTNSGNVTISNLVINETAFSGTGTAPVITCPVTTLTPGASTTCTASYTVTQADVDAGTVTNTATASGTDPSGGATTSPPSTATVTVNPAPALTLTKTATPTTVSAVGDTVAYSFAVTNSGNVTINNLVINETAFSGTGTAPVVTCPVTTLAPGESTTCTASYTVTQADIDAGSITNTATASGTDPGNNPATSPPSSATVTVNAAPALTSTKAMTGNADEDGDGAVSVGDTLTYTITVTNTGNVSLTDVVVTDNKISPNSVTCTTLAPSATCVLTGTYRVTQADTNAGNVVNAAVVTTATPGACPAVSTAVECNPTVTVPVKQEPKLSSVKAMTGNADEDGNGAVSVGDTLTYTITVTNTGNVSLTDVVVTDNKIVPSSVTCASVAPAATCVLTGTYRVTRADAEAGNVVNAAVVTTATPGACPAGSTAPECSPTVTVNVTGRPAIAATKTATLTTDLGTPGKGNAGDVITYAVTVINTGDVTLTGLRTVDTFENGTPTTLTCAPTTLAPGAMATCNSYTHTITEAEANAGGTLDNVVLASATYGTTTQTITVTATSTAVVAVEPEATVLRVSKQANPRDVNIGDLVRYTVTVENLGQTAATDVTVIDTPPAGFSYVDGSLQVADTDKLGRLVGTFPVRVDQIDIPAGGRATLVYLLRVGAGVRPGVHVNRAYAEDGGVRSNVATAEVQLVADPLLDESLIIGTVFDDRDRDGWQDPAELSGIRVQGGFAPGAYIANSTTVDRGTGPAPEADASSPMLHGIDLGKIAARQSDADPVAAHTVVISQKLNALEFTDDFAMTTAQGLTVRMDKAGNSRVERSGDAAKGLTGADPKVERRVAQVEGGYQVDYIVSNAGVDERGIPGVRLATVEGVLIETDQFGRYHLEGVPGGPWERGRNFIVKLDPATLPPGSVFTTDNPLVRRITPGLPVRFDFGVKLPPGEIPAGKEEIELRIGEVFFAPGSAVVTPQYLPAVEKMAEQVREHGGGEVVIVAQGEYDTLAMDRALAVRKALEGMLSTEQLKALTVSVRTQADFPETMVVGFSEWPLLGEVLFDTDRSTIKPQYRPLIEKMAAAIEQMRSTRLIITGHTDKRASDDYNVALGMRRAKAVYDAIAEKISPEVRAKFRVDLSNDPAAPAGNEK